MNENDLVENLPENQFYTGKVKKAILTTTYILLVS